MKIRCFSTGPTFLKITLDALTGMPVDCLTFGVLLNNYKTRKLDGMSHLIGVELLREYIETVILTAYIDGHSPVSTMLIADPERGKTSVVLNKQCPSLMVLTDCTGKGLQHLCMMAPDVSHFVLNDMSIIGAHSRQAREYFFSMLIAMTEEGIRNMAGPQGVEKITGGRRGFIGCITSTQAGDQRTWWHTRGLARRIVPFHFDYSQELIIKIKTRIDQDSGASFAGEDGTLKVPKIPIKVIMSPHATAHVRMIADHRAGLLGQLGMSLLKNYRALARAHAVRRSWKKAEVRDEDILFLRQIDNYVDWQRAALL